MPVPSLVRLMLPALAAVLLTGLPSLEGQGAPSRDSVSVAPNPGWGSVYAGVSEALVPAFVNFGVLSASWLLVAVGMWRRPA